MLRGGRHMMYLSEVNAMWKLKLGPWEYKLVRSEPLRVGSSRLVYVARIFSFTRRRATIGQENVSCEGQRFASIRPVAVVADQKGLRRLLPIMDLNSLFMWVFAGICLASFLAARTAGRALDQRAEMES